MTHTLTTAVTATAYQTNLLLAALMGGPPMPFVPAPRGPCGSGSRTTRYAAFSGISRTSSSTAICKEPRTLWTMSSFALNIVTFPMVGWSVFGRMIAEPKWSAKAFELAVEKVAVPAVSVAEWLLSSWAKVALLELARSKRADPARIWMLPTGSVLRRSPLKTVAPTDAVASPKLARFAKTTVPYAADG